MSRHAFPDLGGLKFNNAHIGPSGSLHGANFHVLAQHWMTGDPEDTWNNCIKPQIDDWKAAGGNCVTFIFSSTLIYGTGLPSGFTTVTTGQYNAAVQQIAEYCDSIDMWFFPSLSQGYEYASFGIGPTEYFDYLAYAAGRVTLYPRTIGCVAIDEADLAGNHADVMGALDLWIGAAVSGMTRPIPITCSLADYTLNDASRGQYVIDAGGSFAAYNHFNGSPLSPSDMSNDIYNDGGGAASPDAWPVVTTSMGVDHVVAGSGPAAAWITGLKSLLQHACIQLTTLWLIRDYAIPVTLEQYYGLYEADGTPRSYATAITTTFPVVDNASYDGSQDAHARMTGSPTPGTPTDTDCPLSWSAASGPGGTVTYTAQYITRLASGCPDFVNDTWHDGTPTTGTSLTLSGLDASTGYTCRIEVESADGGLTYSPWTTFTTDADGGITATLNQALGSFTVTATGLSPYMSKSNTFENELLLHIFNNAAIALVGDATGVRGSVVAGNLYVAFHAASPGEAGNQSTNECSYGGYARVAVPRTSGGWTVSGNQVTPTSNIDGEIKVSGGDETATHWSVGVAASGGSKVLYFGTIAPSLVITDGFAPRLSPSTVITEE